MSKEMLASSLNMSMRLVSETAAVIITTILSILVIAVIFGNSLVCLIVKRNKDLRYEEVTLPGFKILIVFLWWWSCVVLFVTLFLSIYYFFFFFAVVVVVFFLFI